MIKLYIFAPAFGLRNASPFCLKIEMALNFLGLDYDVEMMSDPRTAPKGKLPFIEAEGQRIADSELIIDWLDQRTDGGLFGGLTAALMAGRYQYEASNHMSAVIIKLAGLPCSSHAILGGHDSRG